MFYNRFARYPVYERFEKIAYFIADRVEDEQDQAFTDEKHQKMENQITKEMIYQYAERNLIELYQDFLNSQAEQYPGIEQYRKSMERCAMKIFWQSFICRFISMDASPMTISSIS